MSILAFDLGGSSLKAGLLDGEGKTVAAASVPLGFDEDRSGRSEAAPAAWWRALGRAADDILGASEDPVEAISLCAFTRTQVFLGEGGRVIRPAITFRDSRGLGPAEQALARPGVRDHADARHLNPFHPLARLLWLSCHEPEAWAATKLVLEPKDFLAAKLTGAAVSDPVSMHWLARAMRGGDASLAAACGIAPGKVPPLVPAGAILGHVRPGLPGALGRLAGVPVAQASTDAWTAAAGLGALGAGRGYCISGTSEVAGLLADAPAEAEGLITMEWAEGLWQLGGPGQNGAAALDWAVNLLAPGTAPFAERLAGLMRGRRSGRPLLFLPYLHGERTPYWDRDLRGAFLGLSADHGPADMIRAVMEGVAFANRDVLSRAESAWGRRADSLRLAGGGARSAVWNQIRADVLGIPVITPDCEELGLRGCQCCAEVALGRAADFAEAADRLAGPARRHAPDPALRPRMDALFDTFREAREGVAKTSHALAAIGRGVAPA